VVHLAAVTLGAAAAYLLDDVAVAVTSSTPRSLWGRRAPALLGGLILIAAAWMVIVLLLDSRTPARSPSALTFELVALVCVAIAAAAVFARTGEAEPGNQVASVVVLVGIGAVIAQPALHVTLFTDGEPDRRVWWSAVAVAAMVVLLVASRDPASRPSLRPPAPPRPGARR
jgi:thiol:disulfide interchange protein